MTRQALIELADDFIADKGKCDANAFLDGVRCFLDECVDADIEWLALTILPPE